MHLRLLIVTPWLFIGLGSGVYAEPNRVQYELQERCGKRAAEVFKSEYQPTVQNTDEGQMLFNYRNHYSAVFNKCFFLEMSNILGYRANPKYSAQMFRLYDLNDNKEYGSYYKRSDKTVPTTCVVLDAQCRSEAEWEALISRYMEDEH
jgi:hypothetical protein